MKWNWKDLAVQCMGWRLWRNLVVPSAVLQTTHGLSPPGLLLIAFSCLPNTSYFLLKATWGHRSPNVPLHLTHLSHWLDCFSFGACDELSYRPWAHLSLLQVPPWENHWEWKLKVHLHLYWQRRTQWQRYLKRRQCTPGPRINKNVFLLIKTQVLVLKIDEKHFNNQGTKRYYFRKEDIYFLKKL